MLTTTPTPTDTAATTVVIRDYFEVVVPIDDVTGAAVIPLRIRRFNRAQMESFSIGWASVMNPPSARQLYRLHDADEQAKDDEGAFVIPDAEIVRRRLSELTPEQLEARAAQERAEFEGMIAFCIDQITAHVWVPTVDAQQRPVRVQREDEDGQVVLVRTGADVAALFAHNGEMLGRITRAISDANTLSPEKKRLSKLFSASTPSSLERPSAVAGPSPAATASDVAPAASAATAPASDRPARRPSGRMAR